GCSNLDAGQLRAALDVASLRSLPRYEVLQPEYNLYDRSSLDGPLLDLCKAEDIGVITYFSLAKGFLSGKYRSKPDLGQSARGEGVAGYLNERGMRILSALDAVAERHSAKQAEVALAWIIARPGITAPIASATTPAQMDSLIRAASLKLSADDVAALDRASS
ncbi:aldo/keto reductase, partial [Mesorhizobium sp. M2A.F.Ca.ET.067.02.1.1]